MEQKKESDIQREIIDFLEIIERQGKLWFSRLNNIGVYDSRKKTFRKVRGQKPGIPDILILMPKRVVFIEVKGPTGKLSIGQVVFSEITSMFGIEYYVVKDVEKVKDVLEKSIKL